MSTTVSYKGNTIATLDNETKTLTTKGTWLEDDIEITDESSGGEVLIVDTPDANGGTIREITTGNAVKLEGAKTVTPSSTQQTITPSQGYSGFSSVVVKGDMYSLADIANRNISGEITISTLITSSYVFYNCGGITKVTLTGACAGSNTNGYWFSECTNLISIEAPLALELGRGTLQGCTSLTHVYLPLVRHLSAYNFYGCTALTVLALPSIRNCWSNGLNGCRNLEVVDFGVNFEGIRDGSDFYNCVKLDTIIIRSASVPVLDYISNFTNTPFASGNAGGTIYIPESLYNHLGDGTASDYQSATNWSTIYEYGTITWEKIEGSIYETQYADGTPIND